MRRLALFLPLVLLALIAPASAAAASSATGGSVAHLSFKVHSIGTGPFVAQAINKSGFVAGTNRATGHAALLNLKTGVQKDLGTLGGYGSEGRAINDRGQVVGFASLAGVATHAFVWDPRTKHMTDIGTLGGTNSYAYAINSGGWVVGASETASGKTHAFLWDPRRKHMTDLGTLGGDRSMAWGINDQGQVVGDSSTMSGSEAFLWTPRSHHMVDLGLLPNTIVSSARSINNRGEVIGFGWSAGDYTSRAFIWSASKGLRPLIGLPAGSNEAYAINDGGYVIGTVVRPDWQSQVSYVWNSRTHVTSILPALTAGDTFATVPFDINNALQVVGVSDSKGAVWTPRCAPTS